jgi:glycogen operon protein
MGLSNYWGYNPLAMFALDPRYASDPERRGMSFAMR